MKTAFLGGADLRRALVYLRPQARRISCIILLTLASAVLHAVEPLLIKQVIDHLSEGAALEGLAVGMLGLGGIILSRELMAAVTNWLTWRTRLTIQFELLDVTVGRLQTLPATYHRDQGVGATMTRLDRGIQGFSSALTEIALHGLPAVVYLISAVGIMLHLDFRLALLVLAFAPLPGLLAARAGDEQAERERSLLDQWARIYSRFNEVLSGLLTVRSFAMEDAEKRRFLQGVGSANQRVLTGVAFDARLSGLQGLCAGAARLAAIGLGSYLIISGRSTVGILVAFLAYLNALFGPLQGLAGIYGTLRRAAAAVGHVYSILDARDHLADQPGAHQLVAAAGAISFDRVSFSHDPGAAPILQDITLEVRVGERLAIVGPSGSGKSTLMALLQRFHDPSSGAIRLDGTDLRELAQKSLRKQIGVVLQDCMLFDDSVRANIAYARPEASPAKVMEAALAANAHEFVQRLTMGYESRVGERGKLLSGGERQRVAIARALLKDPPILILDEATSALDAEAEQLVQQALERLMAGRTTFIVAHRLSTVVNADRIAVLKDGRIHELGTHAELLAANGYYAYLVGQQLRGLPAARAA